MNDQTQQSKRSCSCSHRCSYLLRLWNANEPGGFTWQASLEIPGTGKRIGFESLEQLFAYLMDLCESDSNGHSSKV